MFSVTGLMLSAPSLDFVVLHDLLPARGGGLLGRDAGRWFFRGILYKM
jgi:hypothetical protein